MRSENAWLPTPATRPRRGTSAQLTIVDTAQPCEKSTLVAMRKQYNFWPGPDGLDAWDVDKLIALSTELPVVKVGLSTFTELDTPYWFKDGQTPTVRSVVEHAQLIQAVDLSFPVILAADGRVMDGMHRIAKALLLGLPTIDAIRFPVTPSPDYRGVRPD